MFSKGQVHSTEKNTTRQLPFQSEDRNPATSDDRIYPAFVTQQAMRTPQLLAPSNILQFQRMIGNRATSTLLTREVRPQVEMNKENKTGLPNNLKVGIEDLSNLSMDDVKVRYNSPKPAQLQALAYTQDTEIHVGPGQEQHLPHEAWHVVQQKQGRVQTTIQGEEQVNINDDPELEQEANVMGTRAVNIFPNHTPPAAGSTTSHPIAQRRPVVQRQVTVEARKKVGITGRKYRPSTQLNDHNALRQYLSTRMQQQLNGPQIMQIWGQVNGMTLNERALLNMAYAILHPRVNGLETLLTAGDKMVRSLERKTRFVEGVGRSTFIDGRLEMIAFLDENIEQLTTPADADLNRRRKRVIARCINALFRCVAIIRENVGYLIEAGYLDRDDQQTARAHREAREIANIYGARLPSVEVAFRHPLA